MEDMTVGNIRKHIFIFSFPLLINNLLQMANLFVNRIWAGKFLGEDAIGAISISMIVLYIMFSLAIGLTIGTSTVISQYFGAKQQEKIGKTVALSFLLVFIISIIMTVVCIIFSSSILWLMDTPPKILTEARHYLIIAAIGFVFLFEQVLIGFIFRAIGDSITPLIFSGISVVVNVILDPFLMLGIYPFPRMEVEGAAVALVISQLVAFLFAMYALQKKGGLVSFRWKNLVFEKEIIKNLLKLGLPSGIQNVVISTGIGITQVFIDRFGTAAIASFAAISVVLNIIMYLTWSFAAGVSVIAGQNMGANNIERVKETLKEGIKICMFFTVIISLVTFIAPKLYLMIFLQQGAVEAIHLGIIGSRILAVPYLFLILLLVFDSFYCGVGDNFTAMILTIVSIWGTRIPLMWLSGDYLGVNGLWIGLGLSYVCSGLISYGYYKTGRWKTKGIVGPPGPKEEST